MRPHYVDLAPAVKHGTFEEQAIYETPGRERLEEAASTTGSGNTEGSARYLHQSQRMRTLSRGVEAARKGTPQNVRFDTPFLTGEKVQPVKIKFSIEKTGKYISKDDAQF